ncbi:MAG: 30S ribosomal protein S15 [Candidatus Woesearchaeota archaeon]
MARMHSRARGKSGSTKPIVKEVPSWLKLTQKEVELLIVKLTKEGKKPSQIGMILRDEYGLPDVKTFTKKSITEILKEKDLVPELPEDLLALIRKAVFLRKHLEENKKDFGAKRGLQLTESKIRRLGKYYRKSKKLDSSWKYDPEKVKLYVQ